MSKRHTGRGSSDSRLQTEEEALTARIIHYFSLGVLQLPEGTTLRAYLAQKLDCDPMRITKKFTGTNCLGKRVYHSCERTTATYEVAKQAVEELAELEARFRNRLERNKEKRTGIMDIEARLLGNRSLGGVNGAVDTNGLAFTNPSVSTAFQTLGQAAAPGPGPGSIPPNANVAAAAAVAAVAAWNPLSQGYPMPPGYAVTAAHGLYGRSAVSGMLPTGSSAISAMQGYGMPSIARAPPPAPVGSHPHQLTSAVLHSHQLQLQQFSHAPGVAGVPSPGQMSKARMAEITVSRVGQSTAMSMIASQAVTSAAGCSAATASNGERSIATPSCGQQLPPALPATFPPPQSASSPPSPVGSSSQAYLPSSPGQMHNPYWMYRQNHHPGGGEQGRRDYPEFVPSGRHVYPPSTAQLGFPHLGMTTSMQHHQWIHQQRHGGGGAVPPNAGISPSQQQQQRQLRDHHQRENQQDQEHQQQYLIQPSLDALKLSSAAPNETTGAIARTSSYSGSGGVSSDGGSSLTVSPRVSRTSTASPNFSEAGCEEPASADAAAVVSAERPTVSDTMASPRELQQMYHKSKSGRRRHHRNKDEASSTVSVLRSNTTGSSSSIGSTTGDGASSRGSFCTSTASPNSSEAGFEEPASAPPARGATSADAAAVVSAERTTVSDTMASPRELQQMYHKSKSGHRRHHRNKDEASSTVSAPISNTTGSSSSLGSATVDGASSRGSFCISGGSSAGGSRMGSGSDGQQNNGKGDDAAAGVSSVLSSSGCESGSSSEQERDKRTSTATDDSQTCAASPRTDVDGAGGLLMGFIESFNKKHKIDQQQQQHLHQQRQPQGKQLLSQQRPKPPSPHAFPRLRHKHAARMEMEARLASSGAGGNGNSSGAKKMRVSSGAGVKPSERSPETCRGGGSGGRAREAVAPPRPPRSTETMNAGMMLHARPESRKRPRDQQGLIGIVTQQGRREDTINSEERASSAGDGTSVSSEGENSEEGGYEENGDGSSWGSSGRYNDASVSEADYGASDERSSSFEERDNNSDGSIGEAVLANATGRRVHVAVAGEVPQERRRSLLVAPCHV